MQIESVAVNAVRSQVAMVTCLDFVCRMDDNMNGIIVDQMNMNYNIGKLAYIHLSNMVFLSRGLYVSMIPCQWNLMKL